MRAMRKNAPAEPVDDRREIDETACDRDVCDVHRPCLVYAFDLNRARARERWLASGGSGGTISLAPP
jgi:hypothetical protein